MTVVKLPTMIASAMPAGVVKLFPNTRQTPWPAAMMASAEMSEKPSTSSPHA